MPVLILVLARMVSRQRVTVWRERFAADYKGALMLTPVENPIEEEASEPLSVIAD